MKILQIGLKVLFIAVLVVEAALQGLTAAALFMTEGSRKFAVLMVIALGLLILSTILFYVFKRKRWPALAGFFANAALVIAVGIFFIPTFKQSGQAQNFDESSRMFVFYRNHLSAALIPVLATVISFFDGAEERAAAKWRAEHLDPSQSVLFNGDKSYKMKSQDEK